MCIQTIKKKTSEVQMWVVCLKVTSKCTKSSPCYIIRSWKVVSPVQSYVQVWAIPSPLQQNVTLGQLNL